MTLAELIDIMISTVFADLRCQIKIVMRFFAATIKIFRVSFLLLLFLRNTPKNRQVSAH
jgi:hypothetical protein